MRTKIIFLAAAAFLLAAARAAQATEVTIVRGGAALATFHQTSADHCIEIHGELAVVEAKRGGELANGLYVTATREDVCTPDNGAGYAGFAEGRFDVTALLLGRFAGRVTVDSYSGGPPLTFDLDLWWLGIGKVTRTHDVFRDGDTINFTFTATRRAKTRGRFTIDGEGADITSASLVSEASGTIVR